MTKSANQIYTMVYPFISALIDGSETQLKMGQMIIGWNKITYGSLSDYKVLLTGHSLGAGVASILTLFLKFKTFLLFDLSFKQLTLVAKNRLIIVLSGKHFQR